MTSRVSEPRFDSSLSLFKGQPSSNETREGEMCITSFDRMLTVNTGSEVTV